MRYRTLDAKLIIETAERLEKRVAERFPDAGLRGVAIELVSLSRDLAKAAKALEAPIWWLRGVVIVAIAAGALMFLFVGTILPLGRISGTHDAIQSVQGIESLINMIILAMLGFLALIRTEERIKRKQVFRKLHGLRSLIHVIDMHQLTKDPAALSTDFKPTSHSPARITDRADLARYLDYCSEMLSITGKIAALFAQSVNDDVVVDGVNDIESLGSNLSRKIWQKITLIDGPLRSACPST
jgi:fumarate reductase subunit D